MKKLHIQKSIIWCEKHDISCVKLYSSNNIFLSNIYDDGTPISSFKNNNNAFLKGKSSNFTSNLYIGGGVGTGSTYNKNKSNSLLPESPTQSETLINQLLSSEPIDSVEDINKVDTNNSE
jgi:hypothetical protein